MPKEVLATSGPDLDEAIGLWVASPCKARLAGLFRQHPDIVDTAEGLARRLSLPAEALAPGLRDHVRLGLLREKNDGASTIYAYDPERASEIDRMLESEIGRRQTPCA